MLADRVSDPGTLTYESGALPIALLGPAREPVVGSLCHWFQTAFYGVAPSCSWHILATELDTIILREYGLLYRIGLPSNTATPLALFVRIDLLCFCSCIRQPICVSTNTAIAAQIMTR